MRCPFSEQLRIRWMYVCVRVYVCARTHIYYIRHSISNATGMREYSGNPPCVSANIQRMQLSIPATGHLSACLPPLFFILARSMGKKQTGQHLFRAHDGLFFFFFFLLFMIYVAWTCVYVVCLCWLHYFWILLSYFADFFFFPRKGKRDSFSRGKGKFSWRLVYGQFERRSRRYDENFIERRGLFNSGGPRCKWI